MNQFNNMVIARLPNGHALGLIPRQEALELVTIDEFADRDTSLLTLQEFWVRVYSDSNDAINDLTGTLTPMPGEFRYRLTLQLFAQGESQLVRTAYGVGFLRCAADLLSVLADEGLSGEQMAGVMKMLGTIALGGMSLSKQEWNDYDERMELQMESLD